MGKKSSKLSKEKARELASKTYFTEEELIEWHQSFMQDCPNGHLSRKGFARIYKMFFSAGDSTDFASLVFNMFDENQNGKIEFEEFVQALSVTSRGSVEEKLQWSFQLYDIDKDGLITREDMLRIVSAIFKMMGNTSYNITKEENTPEKRVDKIFNLMDKNHADCLTAEEFVEGAKQDPQILEALCIYANLS